MAAVLAMGPLCPGCSGTGEVNAAPCVDCGGRKVAQAPRRGWRRRMLGVADRLATPAGTVVRWSTSVPGVAGAAGITYGVAAVVHGVFGQVPELGVAAIVAGVFGLLADRRL